jgi:hypothetical protein
MRRFLRYASGLLALSASLCLSAAPYPTEQEFKAAIAKVAPILAEETGLQIVTRKAGEDEEVALMSADLKGGKCEIAYALETDHETLADFFTPIEREDTAIWLEAIVAHESMHCVDYKRAFVDGDLAAVVPPALRTAVSTKKAYLARQTDVPMALWSEAGADLAAVLYLCRQGPQRCQQLAKLLGNIRSGDAKEDAEHDTHPWIDGSLELIPELANTPLFAAAAKMRRELAPRFNDQQD